MFGKRPGSGSEAPPPRQTPAAPASKAASPPPAPPPLAKSRGPEVLPAPVAPDNRSEQYYEVKLTIFNALIDTIDLAQLARLDAESAREEIRDIVNEIIAIKNVTMSIAEQECPEISGAAPRES